jgi:hypothetical protein
LPLHQARIPVSIRLRELPDYAKTFFCSGKVANISVDVPYGPRFGVSNAFPSRSDVKDLLFLCADGQAITIRFKGYIYHEFPEMLRNRSNCPKLFEYIKTRVGSAHFAEGFAVFDRMWWPDVYKILDVPLYLTVKRQFGQYWMGNPYLADYEQKLELWRHELGVKGMKVYPKLAGGMFRWY